MVPEGSRPITLTFVPPLPCSTALLSGRHLGEVAALGAALCWVFTSLAFAAAGRRVGATAVNLTRLLLAVVALATIHRLAFGRWIPDAGRDDILYLALSGVIGLALGDQLLFTALVDVGPRTATLLMTLAPPLAALLAWPTLGEPVTPRSALGILITVAGIAWVVLERSPSGRPAGQGHRRRGIAFSCGAALCQALGLVLAKIGLGHSRRAITGHVDPWSATLIRMTFAAVAVVLVATVLRRALRRSGPAASPGAPPASHWPIALGLITVGAIFGPVLGVWFSLVAVDLAPTGIAATLMAMSPIFILPLAVWLEKEHLTWRAVTGAILAVAGVVVLTS